MNDIFKSALLLFNEDRTKFLVTKKKDPRVPHWLLPGGKMEGEETPKEALVREIREELCCEVDPASLVFVGQYESPAAGDPDKTVHITLYQGNCTGTITPGSEIQEVSWLCKEDQDNPRASEIIRVKMIPDLVTRGLLI